MATKLDPIVVDLSKDNAEIVVFEGTLDILREEETDFFGRTKLSRSYTGRNVLTVQNVQVDAGIKLVGDAASAIRLRKGNDKSTPVLSKLDWRIDASNLTSIYAKYAAQLIYQIVLEAHQIRDYVTKGKSTVEFTFSLLHTEDTVKRKGVQQAFQFILPITFKPAPSNPIVFVRDMPEKLIWSANGRQQLGMVIVRNNSSIVFSQSISNLLLEVTTSEGGEIKLAPQSVEKSRQNGRLLIEQIPAKQKVEIPFYYLFPKKFDPSSKEFKFTVTATEKGKEPIVWDLTIPFGPPEKTEATLQIEDFDYREDWKNDNHFTKDIRIVGDLRISCIGHSLVTEPYTGYLELKQKNSAENYLQFVVVDNPQIDFEPSLQKAIIKDLAPDSSLNIPVEVRFDRMEEPATSFDITFSVLPEKGIPRVFEVEVVKLNIPTGPSLKIPSTVRSYQGPNLPVLYQKEHPVLLHKNRKRMNAVCANILLGNTSNIPDAYGGVVFGDFTLSYNGLPATEIPSYFIIKTNAGSKVTSWPASELPHLPPVIIPDLEKDIYLRLEIKNDAPVAQEDLDAVFVLSYRTCIVDADVYKYRKPEVAGEALEQEGVENQIELRMTISRQYDYSYLSIDLGTSAIVAAKAKTEAGLNFNYFDLQKILRDLLGSEYKAQTMPESSTKFLSSNIVLRDDGGQLMADDYQKQLTEISPVAAKLWDFRRRIPNIKMLLGFYSILDVNPNVKGLKYLDPEGNEMVCTEAQPLRIDQLIQNVFYSLFKHFLKEKVSVEKLKTDLRRQIVLTIPNTFSPLHTAKLLSFLQKTVAAEDASAFNEIFFLSESDAVAIQYIDKWRTVNSDRQNIDRFSTDLEPEYLLVYDIGAGTLDLTYLKKQIVRTKDGHVKDEVQVLGRMGKNTAGNYIDYVLARSLFEMIREDYPKEGKFGFFTFDPFSGSDGGEIYNLEQYRAWIRNTLKPRLAALPLQKDADHQKFSEIYVVNLEKEPLDRVFTGNFSFSMRKLLERPRVQALLAEISDETFRHFFQLFRPAGIEQVAPIDTVIFSGRTSQIRAVREMVAQSLATARENPIQVVDIGRLAEGGETDDSYLKGVVARGALRFATHYRNQQEASIEIVDKHLNVRYGILYGDLYNDNVPMRFKELLGPKSQPNTNNAAREPIFISDFEKIDVRRSREIYLIQTYLTDKEDFQREFDKRGRVISDYTTMLMTFIKEMDFPFVRQLAFQVELSVHRGMTLTIANGEDIDDIINVYTSDDIMRGYNLTSHAYRQSMWPYPFQNA